MGFCKYLVYSLLYCPKIEKVYIFLFSFYIILNEDKKRLFLCEN